MVSKIVSAAIVVAAIASMVGFTQTTFATPPKGNNGTLKVHEKGTESGFENNDPKVCSFNFEGFGFDAKQSGYVVIETQGGSQPVGQNAGPFNFGPTNQAGYAETVYFNVPGGATIVNGTYKATLYGKMGPKGQLTDEKAKSKVFKVNCEPRPPVEPPVEQKANVTASLVCDEDTSTFTLTIKNSGNKASNIMLNDDSFVLGAGQTVEGDIEDDGEGVMIELVVDGKVYGEYDGTRPYFCKQGNGSTTPTTPTTPSVPTTPTTSVTTPVQTNGLGQVSGVTSDVEDVASLPYTGGMNAQLTAIAVMVAAFVGGIAHFYSRSRSVVEL